MDLYLAAVYSNGYCRGQARYEKLSDRERGIVDTRKNILESYHYVGKQKFVDEMRANDAKVFLDSGAFSAHTLGVELSVAEYCSYIQRNEDIIRVEQGSLMASVLDGIGDPLQTYRNQLEMEWRGVQPLPCFHFGEDERYLEHYISNYEYITIGGMVGKSVQDLTVWLDRIWNRYMLDAMGRPRVRLHAFGITSVSIMERYPWYSCDSSSWIQSAAFGSIVHPRHGPLSVSTKSPSRHDLGRHVSTLTTIEKDYIHNELDREGFNYERLSTIYESRAAYNLWSYAEIGNLINTEHKQPQTKILELF